MSELLVGFDSAWTPSNSGAIVGVLRRDDGTFQEIGIPQIVNYPEASEVIIHWQADYTPTATLVLLDQPTIVGNSQGQRPVENIVSTIVGRRYGGVQPANTARKDMFGEDAPVWAFLNQFGGAADPFGIVEATLVIETYPVLAIISSGWTLPDERSTGRLPKYNPARKKTFDIQDWEHVCESMAEVCRKWNLTESIDWLEQAAKKASPGKGDQDQLDAYLCLLTALILVDRGQCLVVGNQQSGYMVVPFSEELQSELRSRCIQTKRDPEEWVRTIQLPPCSSTP